MKTTKAFGCTAYPGGRVVECTAEHSEWATYSAHLLTHAPELLKALQDLVDRCDGEEGVRADGSNIQTMRAHAVLAKLEAWGIEA